MGRKSRYKKYKAVDPFCVGQRKNNLTRLENVFNKAPKKEDFEQKPPKGFLELMNSMKQGNNQKEKHITKKKRKAEESIEEKEGDDDRMKKKKFERRPWESDMQFITRVDRIAQSIVNKEKMEIIKTGGDKDMAPKKLTKEKERKLKRIKKTAAEAKRKKQEEQEEYTKAARNEEMLESLEKEMMKDKVEFGEVAMAPPILTKAPRKSQDAAKPGQRELLLKGLVSMPQSGSKSTQQHQKKAGRGGPDTSSVQKKGKRRKDMSALEKERFDQTRSSVIEAYRKQKNTTRISLPLPGEDLR
ncbi:coiled-coil domain-containing protein 137-like [Lytechinus pictus]|uniref:coiled-coil domain-containing protein 137-like n=1 Tax=Lytechinus pictus TaxID=7653 RepID=UPI0030BA22D1